MSGSKREDEHEKLWIDGTMAPRRELAYFDEMKRAGVTASVVTSPHWDSAFYKAIQDVLGDHQWIEDSEGKAILATSVADIKRAHREGKVAILLAAQDAKIIEDQLGFLKVFYNLGVRIIELTHMHTNLIGDGTLSRKESGLTHFGIEVVKEMNKLGMVIDLAHSGHQTTMEAIELSKAPTIFTHANVYSLSNIKRNKKDEAIKALAEKGGVMGLTVLAHFCETTRGVWPTIEDFLKHIDYIVKLVGVDHVAVSLDIDQVGYPKETVRGLTYTNVQEYSYAEFLRRYPGQRKPPYLEWVPPAGYPLVKGMESLECFHAIEKGLLARGYSEKDVEKVLGGNWLRVFEQVWGR